MVVGVILEIVRHLLRIGILLLVVAAVTSCKEQPAQIIVVFRAEPGVAAQAVSLQVVVENAEGEEVLRREEPVEPSGATLLARVPLVPLDQDASRSFRIQGTLFDQDGEVVASSEGIATYVDGQVGELLLWFRDSCAGIECARGQTCFDGTCVGSCRESEVQGLSEDTPPLCGECQTCVGARCQPVENGSPCGCEGTDSCQGGRCETSKPVKGIISGRQHACARVDRDIYCWGENARGYLGVLGVEGAFSPTPVRVDLEGHFPGAASSQATCLLTHLGQRSCFGDNQYRALALGVNDEVIPTPQMPVAAEPEWATLAAGANTFCGIARTGALYCWGSNHRSAAGQPGEGGTMTEPALVDDTSTWLALSYARRHGCALRADNTIWCWGVNSVGQHGVGDTTDSYQLRQAGCFESSDTCFDDYSAVLAGGFHQCGIREDSSMWCWGGGQGGQLGVGPLESNDILVPLRIELDGWRSGDGGEAHTCGIREDGGLWCWGMNDEGQLGLGDKELRREPVQVSTRELGTWSRVDLGDEFSCAIRDDETLWCWGQNTEGQLGRGYVGDSEDTSRPRQVCFPPE